MAENILFVNNIFFGVLIPRVFEEYDLTPATPRPLPRERAPFAGLSGGTLFNLSKDPYE